MNKTHGTVEKSSFGTSSEKELRAIKPIVDKIEALDGEYSKLTDEQLKAKTPRIQAAHRQWRESGRHPARAFAACREAAWRVLGMKPTGCSSSAASSCW